MSDPSADVALCRVERDNKICMKPRHRGRHKWSNKPHVAPERKWERIDSFQIRTGLKRKPVAQYERGCKVGIWGKQGSWLVVDIEQHTETGRVVVSCNRDGGIVRMFATTDLKYRNDSTKGVSFPKE